jgi:hypothetical protein
MEKLPQPLIKKGVAQAFGAYRTYAVGRKNQGLGTKSMGNLPMLHALFPILTNNLRA